MDVLYHPEILDEVVTRALLAREAAGDPSWSREYHLLADPLYPLPEPVRISGFERIQASFFRKLGFAAPLERALAEAALDVAGVSVERAPGPAEEEADLASADGGRPRARVRVRPSRFDDLAAAEGFFRHEFRHVADMLRPAFGYRIQGRLADRPAEENLVRARLRLFWNLNVAGRLEREGRRGAATREQWARTAANVLPWLPAGVRETVVGSFWDGSDVTWPGLVEDARHPERLVPGVDLHGGGPGALCPLCNFPTHGWAADLEAKAPALLAAVRADFPAWSPARGACRQCIDSYELRARFMGAPTPVGGGHVAV